MKTDEEVLAMLRKVVYEINQTPLETRRALLFKVERELKTVMLSEEDRVDGLIYITKNLTMFKDIPGNRIINENSKRIRELADSIREIGNKAPVLLNEKDQIIDGQRRVIAVRRYGLSQPIRFTYDVGGDIDTVSAVNQFQLKWNYKDWLNKYSLDPNKNKSLEYTDYKKIADKYEKYMRSRSLRGLLMNGKVDALSLEIWEGGKFKINREILPDNIKFLELLKQVFDAGGADNIFAKNRDFQKALFEIFKNSKKLDPERLVYKIKYHFNRLNIKTDYRTYKRILGEIYNVRLAGDKGHAVTEEPPENDDPPLENSKEPELSL